MINARAVGNMVHLNGGTSAAAALIVENAAVVWRATAHVTIVVVDGSRGGKCYAVVNWRGPKVGEDGRRLSAIVGIARAARASIILDVKVDAGGTWPLRRR